MKSEMETFDLVVTGGGIFGLWVAKHAVDVGLSVLVAEKDTIGAGASGGLLGALMPHIPTGWNEKKQFQFDALYELSEEVAALEEATGCETGYGRVGRLMPLRAERFCALADDRGKAAREVWHQRERTFDFARGGDQRFYSWLSTDYAPYGYVHDTFAARVRPVDYLAALKAYLEPRATITEGLAFDRFREGQASFNGGARQVRAGAIALAHGYQTFDYLNNHHALDIGSGVKGQSALFELGFEPDRPVIYDDGVYIVPHDNGTCAVGSTSEKVWDHPSVPDLANTAFLEKATALCPSLANARLLRRWAGVRPKCHEREPIIGRLFESQSIFIATGGFKVSFGIAHRVAKALVDEIVGVERTVQLPVTFQVSHHLSAAAS